MTVVSSAPRGSQPLSCRCPTATDIIDANWQRHFSLIIQSLTKYRCPAEFAILVDNLLIFLRQGLANGMACVLPAISLVALVASGCSPDDIEQDQVDSPKEFVGSALCESCHRQEFSRWQGSHHQLAMQVASTDTVLGNFSDVTVPYFDTEARFTTHSGKLLVTMTDATGLSREYRVTHTFGVTPLQQYLVATAGGRKQALQFAWDSRPRDDGGQRWYHLYANENIGPDDPLHWTGRYFNWNYMCAECHSTNVQLDYDLDTDTFDTSFSEVSVGCEACHGPGSNHIAQAEAGTFDGTWGLTVDLNDRRDTAWIMNPDTGIAERSRPNTTHQQPDACGRCHARRSVVAANYEYGRLLADTHMVALLDEHLYFADGRIKDEVYVYGSFVQSKMYAAGVTCSDCHDPHSGELHTGPDPNDICATCHLPTKYAVSGHAGSTSSDCVACHMQATTYMGVDPRRDHSFRLPDTAIDPGHYGAIIGAGRDGGANDKLLEGIANTAYPPIARATMLTLLEPIDDPSGLKVLRRQLDDPDPLVRIGALRALRNQRPEVRLEDARAFAGAADDFREAMTATSAMPDAALTLAEFETRLGNRETASRMYEHALRIGAESAAVQHAYGLYLVRQGNSVAALNHLRQSTQLAPNIPEFLYVYGVALNSSGQSAEAGRILEDAWKRFPDHYEIGWALATISRDRGDLEKARLLAEELVARFPERPQAKLLLSSLQE